MSYEIARLDEIAEITDGRCPFRPVRLHFGISSFGVNVWMGRGLPAIGSSTSTTRPESRRSFTSSSGGRAAFELDGERRDAPAGTFVFVEPG